MIREALWQVKFNSLDAERIKNFDELKKPQQMMQMLANSGDNIPSSTPALYDVTRAEGKEVAEESKYVSNVFLNDQQVVFTLENVYENQKIDLKIEKGKANPTNLSKNTLIQEQWKEFIETCVTKNEMLRNFIQTQTQQNSINFLLHNLLNELQGQQFLLDNKLTATFDPKIVKIVIKLTEDQKGIFYHFEYKGIKYDKKDIEHENGEVVYHLAGEVEVRVNEGNSKIEEPFALAFKNINFTAYSDKIQVVFPTLYNRSLFYKWLDSEKLNKYFLNNFELKPQIVKILEPLCDKLSSADFPDFLDGVSKIIEQQLQELTTQQTILSEQQIEAIESESKKYLRKLVQDIIETFLKPSIELNRKRLNVYLLHLDNEKQKEALKNGFEALLDKLSVDRFQYDLCDCIKDLLKIEDENNYVKNVNGFVRNAKKKPGGYISRLYKNLEESEKEIADQLFKTFGEDKELGDLLNLSIDEIVPRIIITAIVREQLSKHKDLNNSNELEKEIVQQVLSGTLGVETDIQNKFGDAKDVVSNLRVFINDVVEKYKQNENVPLGNIVSELLLNVLVTQNVKSEHIVKTYFTQEKDLNIKVKDILSTGISSVMHKENIESYTAALSNPEFVFNVKQKIMSLVKEDKNPVFENAIKVVLEIKDSNDIRIGQYLELLNLLELKALPDNAFYKNTKIIHDLVKDIKTFQEKSESYPAAEQFKLLARKKLIHHRVEEDLSAYKDAISKNEQPKYLDIDYQMEVLSPLYRGGLDLNELVDEIAASKPLTETIEYTRIPEIITKIQNNSNALPTMQTLQNEQKESPAYLFGLAQQYKAVLRKFEHKRGALSSTQSAEKKYMDDKISLFQKKLGEIHAELYFDSKAGENNLSKYKLFLKAQNVNAASSAFETAAVNIENGNGDFSKVPAKLRKEISEIVKNNSLSVTERNRQIETLIKKERPFMRGRDPYDRLLVYSLATSALHGFINGKLSEAQFQQFFQSKVLLDRANKIEKQSFSEIHKEFSALRKTNREEFTKNSLDSCKKNKNNEIQEEKEGVSTWDFDSIESLLPTLRAEMIDEKSVRDEFAKASSDGFKLQGYKEKDWIWTRKANTFYPDNAQLLLMRTVYALYKFQGDLAGKMELQGFNWSKKTKQRDFAGIEKLLKKVAAPEKAFDAYLLRVEREATLWADPTVVKDDREQLKELTGKQVLQAIHQYRYSLAKTAAPVIKQASVFAPYRFFKEIDREQLTRFSDQFAYIISGKGDIKTEVANLREMLKDVEKSIDASGYGRLRIYWCKEHIKEMNAAVTDFVAQYSKTQGQLVKEWGIDTPETKAYFNKLQHIPGKKQAQNNMASKENKEDEKVEEKVEVETEPTGKIEEIINMGKSM